MLSTEFVEGGLQFLARMLVACLASASDANPENFTGFTCAIGRGQHASELIVGRDVFWMTGQKLLEIGLGRDQITFVNTFHR